ncbi:MFS transporter [Conexibacter sp. W3-3-2]|uniref:MFS transporter n=1 Tax=Paraconexibacter algicola TaxID=2133960 RepID=A0A2T4UK72_9ACTN|nr:MULTISPECIES: MFS transporter [Solirubrobacterales]MTD45982.1 MFS transporter [Conexibacter sp. W3-3-2]PTL59643.1 MFS transporter [Paraconexibacter algicola]
MSRRLVLLLAVVCGAAVANLYYAQPLLDTIAGKLDVSTGLAGVVVTATQLGYAAGLVLIVPLGDLLERRALIVRLLLACALALALTAAAPSFAVLAAALGAVGVTAVVAQVLVPMAATLAPPEESGRVVGTVMSGLLIGILAARTVSGVLSHAFGWRSVYAAAAVLMLVLALVLWRALPRQRIAAQVEGGYRGLLRSIPGLVREEPLLRRRMLYGAAGMATFSVLWTSLTFLLTDAPYDYGDATVGLFGLFGLAGALSAQAAGRFADRGRLREATGGFWACVLLGWALLAFGRSSLAAVIAGIVVLDLGVQGQHISNQAAIFTLRPEARSRLNTAYMAHNFLWGAVGSAGAAAAYALAGWGAVVALGAAFAVVAFLAWVREDAAHDPQH